MARKFLYVIAILIVLVIAALFAMRIFQDELTELTFVPRAEFEVQAPPAANVYADPALWISRPGKGAADPAQWRPDGLTEEGEDAGAAVFFVHPTSYLEREHWNGPLDDAESRTRAELFVRSMASPFNRAGAIWAPRYRQAAFGAFLTDAPEAARALDAAYADIAAAFEQFLIEAGPDRAIVLAGHSQGAFQLKRLVKERVAGTPLAARVVAVYAVGWPVSLDHDLPAMAMPACSAPAQTGCVLSWLSFAEPADTGLVLKGYGLRSALDGRSPKGSAFLCSNPVLGMAGGETPASANAGTLVPNDDLKDGKLVKGSVPARCGADGFLYLGDPPEMGSYVLPGNNYHVYDIPLFWMNLRADAERRVRAWTP